MKCRTDSTDRNPTALIEQLEPRTLMTIVIENPVADFSINRGTQAPVISLANRYTDPQITGLVRMTTNSGVLDIGLFGGLAPNTVTNFLNYVNSGAYNNTIFHREQVAATQGIGILQGGGFRAPQAVYNTFPPVAAARPQAIPTNAPIALENPTGNLRGTIAMARTSVINSATSSFFFNTTNNGSILDDSSPGTPDTGYAVFGQLFPSSLATLDALTAFTDTDFSQDFGNNFGDLPLRIAPNNQGFVEFPIAPTDYLSISSAVHLTGVFCQLSVTSSNANLVIPTISGNSLSLTPVANAVGTAQITVHIVGFDGTTLDDVFDFTINNALPVVDGLQSQRSPVLGETMWINAFGVRDPDAAFGSGLTSAQFWFDADGSGTFDVNADTLLVSDNSAEDGWRGSFSTVGLSAGTHLFFTRIIDIDGGATVTSRSITLAATPATGTFNPANPNVSSGFDIDVTIQGLPDASTLRRVSLFIDTDSNGTFDPLIDRDLGDAVFGTYWSFRVRATHLAGGINTIFARAVSNAGGFGGIATTQITVN